MRHHRTDVVARALAVLDEHGLADLTMRRLAAELDVRPSALYHHVTSKQELLAAVADEVLRRGERPVDTGLAWDDATRARCRTLRDAVLAYRDGAEVVATTFAFGLGARDAFARLVTSLEPGCGPDVAPGAAATLWHFVLGHATDEQTHLQAGAAGAVPDGPRSDRTAGFELGVDLILDGVRARSAAYQDAWSGRPSS